MPDVNALGYDSNGLLLPGGTGVLYHFDGLQFTPYKELHERPAFYTVKTMSTVPGSNGTIWDSTFGEGVAGPPGGILLDPSALRPTRFLFSRASKVLLYNPSRLPAIGLPPDIREVYFHRGRILHFQRLEIAEVRLPLFHQP